MNSKTRQSLGSNSKAFSNFSLIYSVSSVVFFKTVHSLSLHGAPDGHENTRSKKFYFSSGISSESSPVYISLVFASMTVYPSTGSPCDIFSNVYVQPFQIPYSCKSTVSLSIFCYYSGFGFFPIHSFLILAAIAGSSSAAFG